MRFHRIERGKDPNFWSVRVNEDIRLIVHRTPTSLLLCYVGHHDAAYAWAERRKIERHPITGAAQLVELRERVEEIPVLGRPPAVRPPTRNRCYSPICRKGSSSVTGCRPNGSPRSVASTRTRCSISPITYPQEAAEALLSLATGGTPAIPVITPVEPTGVGPTVTTPKPDADPFAHPDAQRRFRVLTNVEELERALDYPWEKWAVFLHPAQRRLVERDL